MPYRVVVQVPGKALKINAEVFKQELQQAREFEQRLLKYSNTRLNEMVQTLMCSRFHSLETRFCYVLLMACDRIGSDTVVMTHEIISDMMGASRTSVTKVANELRDAGLIRYRREKITVTNREGVRKLACDCYNSEFESRYIAVSA
jgi:CRP-like cAMP-binding protein